MTTALVVGAIILVRMLSHVGRSARVAIIIAVAIVLIGFRQSLAAWFRDPDKQS